MVGTRLEVKVLVGKWRIEYNHIRPHYFGGRSINYSISKLNIPEEIKLESANLDRSKITVFIAYARGDEDKYDPKYKFTTLVYKHLTDAGFNCVVDQKFLLPGDKWNEMVEKTLPEPACMTVSILSSDFINSPYCKKEYNQILSIQRQYGKSFTLILIDEFREWKKFVGTMIPANFRKLFNKFKSFKNAKLTDEFNDEFNDGMESIILSVEKKYMKFLTTPHLYNVKIPTDKILKDSFEIYKKYPEHYRDEPSKIKRWISELSLADPKVFYNDEPYIVLSLAGKVYGVLYASVYKPYEGYPCYSVINDLVINEDFSTLESIDKSLDDTPIAELLLTKFKEVTDSIVERDGKICYFSQLPNPALLEDEERINEAEKTWKAWNTIRSEFNVFKVMKCPNIRFILPDEDWHLFDPEDVEECEGVLLFLIPTGDREMIPRKTFKSILEFNYMVYFGEAYNHPYSLKDWIYYLDDLRAEALGSIDGEYIKLKSASMPVRELEEKKSEDHN